MSGSHFPDRPPLLVRTSPVEGSDAELDVAWDTFKLSVAERDLDAFVDRELHADIPLPPPIDARLSWKRVENRLSAARPVVERRQSRFAAFGVVPAVLSAVVIFVIGGVVSQYWASTPSFHAAAVYSTPKGSRATVELSDGTKILLNAASRLEIPEQFGGASRAVRLYGEAYFDVVHASGAPFVVQASGTRTTVLGTEFSVRAYDRENVQVAVRTGKVAVDTTVLGVNDVARISNGRLSVLRDQSLVAVLGFTSGRLVITKRPLRDAIADLNRWYNVDIRLGDDALGNMLFDAVLMDGSIGDLMEVLQVIFDVRVVRNGQQLTLYSR